MSPRLTYGNGWVRANLDDLRKESAETNAKINAQWEREMKRQKAEAEIKKLPDFPTKVLAARKKGAQQKYNGYVNFWKTSDGSYDNGLFYDDLQDAKEHLAEIESEDKFTVRMTGTPL